MNLSPYLAVFRIRFSNSLQYRAAALAGISTQFAWGFMSLLAFSAFYRVNPNAFPMEFSQTVSYIWIQQAFLAFFAMWFFENDILTAISSGSIAYELVRPVDIYHRWFCQSAANRLARSCLRCAPILIVAFLLPEPFRMSLPASPVQFLLFLFSAALSLGVVISFCMLIYISSFYMISSLGIRIITATLTEFLSGAVIPLPFFPERFRVIAELLPFAAMENLPLRIYSGNLKGADTLRGILLQIFWLLALYVLGRFLMKGALKKVVVQGG
ncbi:ABC transporter permease [Spirochaetia bacterium]|nr:ABC transporter permease [Spirochaetia bacterium]